jgi:hypothetical protein
MQTVEPVGLSTEAAICATGVGYRVMLRLSQYSIADRSTGLKVTAKLTILDLQDN